GLARTRLTTLPARLGLVRLVDLERRWLAERRLVDRDESLRFLSVGLGERLRRAAELDQRAVWIVGVDRRAPTVVDLDHVVSVVEQPLPTRLQLVERRRRERDVVHPRRQAESAADRGVELGDRLVVQIPHREQLTVAGVEEHVARPTGLLERRRGLDL